MGYIESAGALADGPFGAMGSEAIAIISIGTVIMI